MKRLLVDLSYIVKRCMYAGINGDNSYVDGEDRVPSHIDGYEITLSSFSKIFRELNMTPQQCILVADGKSCKQMRRQFVESYCANRKKNDKFLEEFYKTKDMVVKTLLSYGAIYVDKEYVEADDIIYFLAEKIDSIVWSSDADLLACAAPVYYDGFKDTSKFLGIPKDTMVVWKSLVGDPVDEYSGCPGFGKETFRSMLEKYGDSCLYDIKGMLEDEALDELKAHVADFKPFQKIIDNQETVYNSYKCAKFYHPGYRLNWKMAYPGGDGVFNEWKPVIKLITAKDLSEEFLREFKKQILRCPNPAFDIETWMDEESLEWGEINKSKTKGPLLDVYGSHMAGFSISCGRNNEVAYYFPIDHKDTDNLSKEQAIEVLNMFDENKPILVHNSSFELPLVKKHYELRYDRGYLPPLVYDTRIMSGFIDEYESPSLKELSKRLMDYSQVTYAQVSGGKKMNELTGVQVVDYGCDDSICSAAVFRFAEVIMKYEDSWKSYIKADLGTQYLYAENFLNGLKFDLSKLEELQTENEVKFLEIDDKIKAQLAKLKIETSAQKTKAFTVTDVLNKNFDVEYETIVKYWPGANFKQAETLSPSEIKRLYKVISGHELSTTMRTKEKLAVLLREKGQEALAEAVEKDDLNFANTLAELVFVPNLEINLRSTKQMSELMYEFLGYPVRIRSKRTEKQKAEGRPANPAANELAIKHAIAYDARDESEIELLKNLLAAKSCLTEESLFYRPYKTLPNPKSGRVHYSSGQSLAKSGRPTASKPNISQISKRSRVREVYVPLEDNHVWVSFDFSSQELLHMAVQSGDENMLACFSGEVRKDLHSITGVGVYSLSNDAVDYDTFIAANADEEHPLHKAIKEARKKAKTVNFLDAFCGTAKTLGPKLLVTEEYAQDMLDAKAKAFPRVAEWKVELEQQHKDLGYAVEQLGRRRHLRLDGSWRDAHELRGAINHRIQGSAATQTKVVMSNIWKSKVLDKFDAYFMMAVYDQLDFSVNITQALDFIKTIHPMMVVKYADYPIDFQSSISLGVNFGQLSEIGNSIDEDKIDDVLKKIKEQRYVADLIEEDDIEYEEEEVEYH